MSLKVHQTSRHATLIALISSVLICIFLAAFVLFQVAHAALPSVRPLSPAHNSYATNQVTLTSKVDGVNPSEYEMFWAVGNGTWNRMTTDTSTAVSSASISIADWNWQQDGRYTIRFIALMKNSGNSLEQSITINKGTSVSPVLPNIAPPLLKSQPVSSTTKKLFVDPQGTIAQKYQANRSNPTLSYMATQPTAQWFGDWNNDVQRDVDAYVSRAQAANSIPTMVIYNIPARDCGSHSAGGSQSYAAYTAWVKQVAAGIKDREAIVVVEPDAVASSDCLPTSEQTARATAISEAVRTLNTPQSKVYVDAGHPDWHGTTTVAARLTKAGVKEADGFSLNTSNFHTTDRNIRYGTELSKKVGDKHFVIDTSRNGNGPAPDSEWCNPPGRALGNPPSLATKQPLVDAFLWIKTPGDSDGACRSGEPKAGEWWQAYAERLYANRFN